MNTVVHYLADSAATERFGMRLAAALPETLVVHLHGDLGAGKTALVRAILRALGHVGAVPSPTYTLVESYECGDRRVHHMDLYRLGNPEELEYLGLRDLLEAPAVLMVEWPERGAGVLPQADLRVALRMAGEGRMVCVNAMSKRASAVIQEVSFLSRCGSGRNLEK